MKFLLTLTLLSLVCFSLCEGDKRSSHSEAPGTSAIPNADITDLYVFRSYESGRTDYVTFLMNVYGLQSPYGGPNYYSLSTEHFYEIYVDRNSDGTEDYTFQWIYGNALGSASTTGRPYYYPEGLQCQELYSNVTIPVQPNYDVNMGIALTVNANQAGGQNVRIALKVAGVVVPRGCTGNDCRGNPNAINWEEHYYLSVLNGPLGSATVNNISSGGSNRFEKPFDYAGQTSFGLPADYETYAQNFIYNIDLGSVMMCSTGAQGKVFVGQRQDPFYISLGRIFDYLNLIPIIAAPFNGLTIADCLTNNDLREKNIDTFALEIPQSCFNAAGSILNVWAGTRALYHAPGDIGPEFTTHIAGPQTSRLGNPLVNELVIGLVDKNRFTRQHPRLDGDPTYGFANYVLYPTLPHIISNKYYVAVNKILGTSFSAFGMAPPTPRNDLVAAFLTGIQGVNKGPGGFVGEVIRLNYGLPAIPRGQQNRYAIIGTVLNIGKESGTVSAADLAGFPNGRRPGDDVVDIALMVMMGALCTQQFINASFVLCGNQNAPIGGIPLTDGSPVQDFYYGAAFPYFNTPTPGSYADDVTTNVVTNPSVCYPASQHGRCPIPAAVPSPTTCPTCPACPGNTCGSSSALSGIVFSLLSYIF